LRRFVDEISLSCRMHPLAAAVGLAQVPGLPKRLAQRQAACRDLSNGPWTQSSLEPPTEAPGTTSSFHRFVLTFDPSALPGLTRETLVHDLQQRGLPMRVGPIGRPIHLRPRFAATHDTEQAPFGRSMVCQPLPVTERRCREQELLLENEDQWMGAADWLGTELVRCLQRRAAIGRD
jgi:dTDP-4-amino-4,6-dideoxygalactose transaminase